MSKTESKNRDSKVITFDRFIRGLIGIVLIVGVGMLLYWLSTALIPFFVAWIVAYLLYPVVSFFQYKCRLKNRLLCIFLTSARNAVLLF